MSKTFKQVISRRSFLRMAGIGAGAAALGFAPAGFGRIAPAVARAAQAARSGTLRVGWNSPTSLDPAKFADAPDISYGISIYDYLLMLDSKSEVQPHLATSWQISDDGTEYTFTLQSGVKWHDGSDFTAEDVKFTFDRLRDEAVGSGARSLYTAVTSIEATDATTVRFVLSEPSAVFLKALTAYQACIIKNGTTDPTVDKIGTGPFKVQNIDITTRAEFIANENYWIPDEPKVERLEFTFATDGAALIAALQGGQLDFVPKVKIELFESLKADASLTTFNIPTNQFPNIRLRADQGPGKDVKVRRAFRLATNGADVAEKVYGGLATPGNGTFVGPLYGDFYDAELAKENTYDPEAAKALLAEAGYADGLTLSVFGYTGEYNNEEVLAVLQEQWKLAGITVDIKTSDTYYNDGPDTWLTADLGITNWASRPDPQAYLDQLYLTGSSYNESTFSDEELDNLINAARVELDNDKRTQLIKDIQRLLLDRGPGVIPYFTPSLFAQSKKVSGIEPAADPGLTSFSKAVITE